MSLTKSNRNVRLAFAGLLSCIAVAAAPSAMAQDEEPPAPLCAPLGPAYSDLSQYSCEKLSREERRTLQICDVEVKRLRGNTVTITWRTTQPATDVIGYTEALEDGRINYFNGTFEGGSSKPSRVHRQVVQLPAAGTKYHFTIEANGVAAEGQAPQQDQFGRTWAAPDAREEFWVSTP